MNSNTQLTEKQLNIVMSETYPQYVRAGAGTGKTEVLINKVLNILDKHSDVGLDNISIITFTNKAAEELKGRLSKAIYEKWNSSNENEEYYREQVELVNMIEIGTIHSFCESLLREYGVQIGLPLNFKIKSFRKETMTILTNIVDARYDNELLKDISNYKMIKLLDILLTNNSNHGYVLSDEDVQNCLAGLTTNTFWNKFKKLYLSMYLEAYNTIEKEKIKYNILTPNDLILEAVSLLQNEYVAKKIAEQYKYIFIDEFQDTNKDQFNLVNLLIQYGVKIFLVGDDKQSIYGFRGADVENSVEMHSIIKNLQMEANEEIYMDDNFRSDRSLIDIINRIFETDYFYNNHKIRFPYEPLVFSKTTEENRKEDNCFEIRFEDEIQSVIDTLVRDKYTFGDIAILCRRNFDLDRISAWLKNKEYPVEVVGGKGFYRAKEVVDTYKLVNAIINCDDAYYNELRFTDYYAAWYSNANKIMTFDDLLTEFRNVLRREAVEESLTYFYEKLMIIEYYKSKKRYQAVANLYKLKDIARELISKDNIQPIQFLDYLNIMITSCQDEDEADVSEIERKNGVIRIYSIHKAKGLSFPVVIVPNIDTKLNRPITKPKIIYENKDGRCSISFNNRELSDKLPADKEYIKMLSEKTIEQLEEELRVFYVACTRAKHKLVLLSEKKPAEIRDTSGWKDDSSVAKWILDIDGGEFVNKYKVEQ